MGVWYSLVIRPSGVDCQSRPCNHTLQSSPFSFSRTVLGVPSLALSVWAPKMYPRSFLLPHLRHLGVSNQGGSPARTQTRGQRVLES